MAADLIAPIYSLENLNSPSRPDYEPGARHWAIVKRTGDQFHGPEEIVFDAGVSRWSWQEDAVFQAGYRDEVARLNQESFSQFIQGRSFTRYLTNWYVAASEAEAQRHAELDKTPPERMRVTAGLEILFVSAHGRSILWSDGKVTGKTGLDLPEGGSVSRPAARLISYAVTRECWLEDGAWRRLMAVQNYQALDLATFEDHYVGLSCTGNDTWKLERIATDTGLDLCLLSQEGGSLGEDGDAWEYHSLYENEHEARVEYRRQTLSVLKELVVEAAKRIEQGAIGPVAEAWPALTAYAVKHWGVKLPLERDMARERERVAARQARYEGFEVWEIFSGMVDDSDIDTDPADAHGLSMYLRGYAAALGE